MIFNNTLSPSKGTQLEHTSEMLDVYIEHARKTRDLSYIRRTQHLYHNPEDVRKIDECCDFVHAWTRRIRANTEKLIQEMKDEDERILNSDGAENIIVFPF